MNLKKNILIVGGTGFIGYHLAKKSLAKGWQVTSISSKSPKKIRYLSQVKYIICDITKSRLLKKSIRKSFDYIVNLGGALGVHAGPGSLVVGLQELKKDDI